MSDTENEVECAECAETVAEDEGMSTVDGTVCQSCYENEYAGCDGDGCSDTVKHAEMIETQDGDWICDGCRTNGDYTECEDCEAVVHYDNTECPNDYHTVCRRCYEWNYTYCDYCDTSYHNDDSYDHDHEDGCDCESPLQKFKVRNDGHDPLANDTRIKVSLPAGELSEEGTQAIARLLQNHGHAIMRDWQDRDENRYADIYVEGKARDEWLALRTERNSWYNLSYRVADVGCEWQSKEGNFTKRLSRFAYKEFGLKVPPHIMSEVGNIGNAHSQGVDHEIEVTRNLNLSAYDFGHDDSCFWQSYYYSRCTLKSEGGYGIRSFGEHESSDGFNVKGRAWVFPLKFENGSLRNTFETENPDAFVVFNGYGNLSGYAPARIVAHMAGMTYRKIGFIADPIYVNSDAGYLVAPEEIAKNYTDGSLTLPTQAHSGLFNREQNDGTICNHFEPCSHAA